MSNNSFTIMKFNTYPDPWDLRYFQEIAHTQNLSRASERLGVGQPALSLSLKRLESLLKTPLFLRRNKGLELTQAGQKLLKECNGLLTHWESILTETKKSVSEIVGRFTLGVHPALAAYTLPHFLGDLYQNYPKLEIELHHGLSRIMSEQVISGKLDFALVVNPPQHPDLILHKVTTDTVGFFKVAKTNDDVLIYNPALTQSQSLLKKIKNSPFLRTITTDSLEVIANLTRAGAGVGILPSRVVKSLAPELKKIESMPTFDDEIYFAYRVDLPKTASTKCVIDAIKKIKI